MDKKYIVANWKMAPQTFAKAEGILSAISEFLTDRKDLSEQVLPVSLVICPPFVFLEEVSKLLNTTSLGQQAELGAQNISLDDSPAMTGEISGAMLAKLGVRYVIVGHSERRWKLGETDEVTNQKLKTAVKDELIPIVCIGERERDGNYKEFLNQQITATFAGISADEKGKCLIAYEPVWAISTNPNARPDKPEDTLQAVTVIKEILGVDTHVLYGGSINAKNAKDFLSVDQIAGVLVGGASVNKEEFVEILKQVQV